MEMLIKKARVIDPGSELNGEIKDILIAEGKIQKIGENLDDKNVRIIDIEGMHVSPGWLDVGVQTGDPGLEHREDLRTVTKAAAAGGFTAVACYPNTNPVMDSKSGVYYLQQNSKGLKVECLPIGAVSEACEGKDITEMIDMHHAGALVFSDGKKSIQHAGLMLRALLYTKAFGGLVMNHPHNKTLSANGQMNEGTTSTMLGLRGIPAISEELMVQRDIELSAYADSQVHITNISTKGAVEKIRAAKAKGIKVSCSVAVINLLLDETALVKFDSNLKVSPPLRREEDVEALKEGLKDGTIDFISSNHVPLEEEVKKLEFAYAEFGAIGLETAFSVAYSALKDVLSLEELIAKFSLDSRRLMGLESISIKEGAIANLSLFIPETSWTVTDKDIHSRSKNSPYVGMELSGRVVGMINGENFEINRYYR